MKSLGQKIGQTKKYKFRTFAKILVFHDFHPEISILTQMFIENYLPRIKFRVEWWQNEVVRAKIWPKEKIQV